MWKILCTLGIGLMTACPVHAEQPTLGAAGSGGMHVPYREQDTCWENAPNLEGQLLGSEVIGQYGIVSETANDFILADSTEICVIRWWGGYFNYAPGDTLATTFNVRIYADSGDCRPSLALVHEREFVIGEDCSETIVHQQSDPYAPIYEYNAYHDFELPGGHYWLSVQAGDHPFPPQWGRLAAAGIDSCGSVFKSAYFSYPDWTPAAALGYAGYEASQAFICPPCPPRPRACCLPDTCSMELPLSCAAAGGIPLGPATVCVPEVCPQQPDPGACCVPDPDTLFYNMCEIRTRGSCDSVGGRWDGAPACSPNPCPDTLNGAPCPPDGSDYFPGAHFACVFDLPGDGMGPRPIIASGPATVIRRGREFEAGGGCGIETEIIQLDLQGVFNPNCFEPDHERQVSIMLANEPSPPSLGTLTSSATGSDPDWPVASDYDAHLILEIDGEYFPRDVAGLHAALQDDNLWAQQSCFRSSEPYTEPSDDYFLILCDPGAAGRETPRAEARGCCSLSPGIVFVTYERICELLHGTYTVNANDCGSCIPESVTGPSEVASNLIGSVKPNPSSGAVHIKYNLAREAATRIELYDAAGRAVRRIDLGVQTPGAHELVWDGNDGNGRAAAAGVYFIRVRAGSAKATKGIVLMR